MDANVARNLASRSHAGQFSRFREPLFEHVERVAQAVPAEARALAYLHDVLERRDTFADELRTRGVTDAEYAILQLLTRRRGETYEAYVMRIARARGCKGRLARIVKLADLEDHLRHARIPSRAPNYAWARSQIAAAISRCRWSTLAA